MPRYIRRCPKCRDYLALVVNEPRKDGPVLPVFGYCLVCDYRIKGWQLILGRKQNARRKTTDWQRIQVE